MTHICENKCKVVGHREYAIKGLVEFLISRVFQLGEVGRACEALEDGLSHMICLLVHILEGSSAWLDLSAFSRLLLPVAEGTGVPLLLG